MIGRLRGRLDHKGTDHVLLDVGGVGYVVHVSDRTLAALPPVGTAVSLWTELLVREDLLQLFGFVELAEREWHRLLTGVQGIGAKASLAILGTLGADGIARAIALGDAAAVRAAPGVGPKIAQRVVNELRDKAPALMMQGPASTDADPVLETPPPTSAEPVAAAPPSPKATNGQAEALSALANLGYAPVDAARAVAASAEDGAATTADLIRGALRKLAPQE